MTKPLQVMYRESEFSCGATIAGNKLSVRAEDGALERTSARRGRDASSISMRSHFGSILDSPGAVGAEAPRCTPAIQLGIHLLKKRPVTVLLQSTFSFHLRTLG